MINWKFVLIFVKLIPSYMMLETNEDKLNSLSILIFFKAHQPPKLQPVLKKKRKTEHVLRLVRIDIAAHGRLVYHQDGPIWSAIFNGQMKKNKCWEMNFIYVYCKQTCFNCKQTN